MKKKILFLCIITVILCVNTSLTSTATTITKKSQQQNEVIFPFWFCNIKTNGTGVATYSGEGIFISITYDDSNPGFNTTITSALGLRSITMDEPHILVIFFFLGDQTLPENGREGNISLNGMGIMAQIT